MNDKEAIMHEVGSESFAGREISRCKGPEVGMSAEYSGGNKKPNEAAAAQGEESSR